jgi:chemotaxis regulatin CheY-phosphate phosphatase CheZ
MSNARIDELKKQIMELKSQWPKHSVSPVMVQQLDDLEEELEQELKRSQEQESQTDAPE